jgi:hypothetical protein
VPAAIMSNNYIMQEKTMLYFRIVTTQYYNVQYVHNDLTSNKTEKLGKYIHAIEIFFLTMYFGLPEYTPPPAP